MSGLSLEGTLALWASSLRDVKARLRVLFRQERVEPQSPHQMMVAAIATVDAKVMASSS